MVPARRSRERDPLRKWPATLPRTRQTRYESRKSLVLPVHGRLAAARWALVRSRAGGSADFERDVRRRCEARPIRTRATGVSMKSARTEARLRAPAPQRPGTGLSL